MRRVALALFASTSLLGFASFAEAADLRVRRAPPPPPAPVAVAPFYNWTGFYVGGHIGWGNAEFESTLVDPFFPFVAGTRFDDNGSDGFLGGVQAGFNWQIGQWVIGLEGQVSWTDIGRDGVVAVGTNTIVHSTGIDYLATLAARFGVAFGNALIYAKGGAAFLDWGSSISFAGPGAPIVGSNSFGGTDSGWMVGAGLEYGFAANWSAKIEYNFMNFDLDDHRLRLDGVGSRLDNELDLHVVKLGINYRFGWPAASAPVVGRY
jgi:outer membrane immunogenic protein